MSLLAKLKAGTQNEKPLKFPGTGQDIKLRVLSEAELQAAALATEQHFKAKKVEISLTMSEAFEAEHTLQLLYRAVGNPDGNPIAKTVDEFRENITRDEKDVLAEEYLAFEQECSPSPAKMSQAEFDELLEQLKKKPAETTGSVSSIVIARQLIISLANQLQSLQKGNGSTSI